MSCVLLAVTLESRSAHARHEASLTEDELCVVMHIDNTLATCGHNTYKDSVMARQIAITVTTNQPNPVPNWRLLNTQVQKVLCVCSEVFR